MDDYEKSNILIMNKDDIEHSNYIDIFHPNGFILDDNVPIPIFFNLEDTKQKEIMFNFAKELSLIFLNSKKELFNKIKNKKINIEEANNIESHLIIDKILLNDNIKNVFNIKYNKE